MWTTNSSAFRAQKAGWECALKSADTEINSEGRKTMPEKLMPCRRCGWKAYRRPPEEGEKE
jgi:hypothetical protein